MYPVPDIRSTRVKKLNAQHPKMFPMQFFSKSVSNSKWMVFLFVFIFVSFLGLDIWSTVATAGLNECMVRGNAAGYGWRGYRCLSMQEAATRGAALRPQDFSVTTKILILTAEYVKEKYQNKFHSKGHNLALRLKKAYDEVLARYDVIILPTMIVLPTPLPDARATVSELLGMVKPHLVNTAPFNIAGHPALTINAGFVDGLPVGMMIVGKYYDELTVLQIARAFEKLKRE